MMPNVLAFDFAGATQKIKDIMEFGAVVIATCSTLANLLPKVEKIANPVARKAYKKSVDIIAFFALNWRRRIPSLDIPFLGFTDHCPHCAGIQDATHDHSAQTSDSVVDSPSIRT